MSDIFANKDDATKAAIERSRQTKRPVCIWAISSRDTVNDYRLTFIYDGKTGQPDGFYEVAEQVGYTKRVKSPYWNNETFDWAALS